MVYWNLSSESLENIAAVTNGSSAPNPFSRVKASRRSASGTITTRPCCGGTSTRSGCSPSQSSLEPQLRGTEAGAKYSAMVMNACEEARQGAVIKLGRLALMAKLA